MLSAVSGPNGQAQTHLGNHLGRRERNGKDRDVVLLSVRLCRSGDLLGGACG
jgi:hypothetical protein